MIFQYLFMSLINSSSTAVQKHLEGWTKNREDKHCNRTQTGYSVWKEHFSCLDLPAAWYKYNASHLCNPRFNSSRIKKNYKDTGYRNVIEI